LVTNFEPTPNPVNDIVGSSCDGVNPPDAKLMFLFAATVQLLIVSVPVQVMALLFAKVIVNEPEDEPTSIIDELLKVRVPAVKVELAGTPEPKESVPPFRITLLFADDALDALNVSVAPEGMVVIPPYVFAPDKVRVPELIVIPKVPVLPLRKTPANVLVPFIVSVALPAAPFSINVVPGVAFVFTEATVMLLPFNCNVPVLAAPKLIAFGVVLFKAPELATCKVPALIVTPPVNELLFDNVKTPPPPFTRLKAAELPLTIVPEKVLAAVLLTVSIDATEPLPLLIEAPVPPETIETVVRLFPLSANELPFPMFNVLFTIIDDAADREPLIVRLLKVAPPEAVID